MIPNINQLVEQLRMLPDAALQRVAMMYKQDPYIFPMVVSEGTMRKKMRTANQARTAAPQPKVNDQAIASLGYTPEEVGIGALQASNMQGMADGGIAGYAEGGDVVMPPGSTASYQRTSMSPGMLDFAQRSEPVIRMAGGGVPGYASRGLVDVDADEARAQAEQREIDEGKRGDFSPETKAYFRRLETERMAANEALGKSMVAQEQARGKAAYQTQGAAAGTPAAALPTAISSGRGASPGGPLPGETVTYPALRGAASPAAQTPAAAPASAAASARAPSAGTGVPAAPADGGIYSLAGRLYDPIEQRTQRQLGQMRMAAQQRADEERLQFESGKPKGQIGEGLEALLKKEAEGETGEREQAKAMAIFNAGLAMMAGGSPRALENIAKGAMVGSGQYAEALKDFKKAAKERQKMLANIEDARRAEARDDNKTAMALLQRANDNESKMEAFALEAGTSLGLKKADLTGRLYGTQMEQEGAMARVRAQDPLALYRALDPTGKGNIAKGFEAAQTAKREPMTRERLYLEYMKNPMNDPANFAAYVQQYERQFGPLGGTAGAASQSADQALVNKYLNPPR